MLNVLWAAFLALAFVCGAMTGRLSEVSAALTEGAAGAVTLAIGIAGLMCFWSGIMELMQQSGLTHIIARFLMPVLRPLFGKASEDSEAMAGGERECHGKSAGPVERRHSARSACCVATA